ncbi:MAG: hypothetical protein ACRDYV_21685, partial [Acidimicrobiia bacterium]
WGLFGTTLEGRAAGRCGSLWAAVEVPPSADYPVLTPWVLERYGITGPLMATAAGRERFMGACIPARMAELRARGNSD